MKKKKQKKSFSPENQTRPLHKEYYRIQNSKTLPSVTEELQHQATRIFCKTKLIFKKKCFRFQRDEKKRKLREGGII